MLTLLLPLAAVLHSGLTSCSKGFEPLFNGKCMRLEDSVYVTDHTAECLREGAYPPSIHSPDENQNFMNASRMFGNSHNPKLGFVCKEDGNVKWWDDSPMDYKNFMSDEDAKCKVTYPEIVVDLATGKWKKVVSSLNNPEKVDVFCQEKVHKEDKCGPRFNHTVVGNQGLCYFMHTYIYQSWEAGEEYCFNDYGHLPSIHSAEMNNFVRRTAIAYNQKAMSIGLQWIDEKSFAWTDGTPYDYANFANGYPMAGGGNHSELKVDSAGQWTNTDLGDIGVSICTQPEEFTNPAPDCPEGILHDNGTISSPGFPWTASSGCEYNLQVATGYVVQLEILFLEANMCCDSLSVSSPGSAPKRLSGHLVGETIETILSKSNTMNIVWSGGDNIKGFTANFRSVKA